jgi:hypothetical protein
MQSSVDPLAAFQSVDFDWVARLDSVWSNPIADASELHSQQRADLRARLNALAAGQQRSQLGMVYAGNPGSGKTHFLGFVRREAFTRGMHFVLVDMTDVKDFWSTLILGYLDSLGRAAAGKRTQLQLVLQRLLDLSRITEKRKWVRWWRCGEVQNLEEGIDLISGEGFKVIKEATEAILSGLQRSRPGITKDLMAHQNVLRALFLCNSRDFETSSSGYAWLQGVALDNSVAHQLGFTTAKAAHNTILKGLSWVMGLRGPTVLAFDQLDAIVAQYNLAAGNPDSVERREEQNAALAIIEGIAGGLSAVVDQTIRTLPVVTPLFDTWTVLCKRGLEANKDRFHSPPSVFRPIDIAESARIIVEARLSAAYRRIGFRPPYPTWPFQSAFFLSLIGAFPRQVLQKCDEHKRRCAAKNEVVELGGTKEETRIETRPAPQTATSRFDELLQKAKPEPGVLEEEQEDVLGELVLRGCELLLKETDPPPAIDHLVDADFSGNKRFPSLHARVRIVFHEQGDREEHVCFRVLQRTNPMSYKARLSAAMTAAGIDRDLPFRKLLVIRTTPAMSGPKTAELTRQFEKRGGLVLGITEADVAGLKLLADLDRSKEPGFAEWLRERRPVSRLAFFGRILPHYGTDEAERTEVAKPNPHGEGTVRPVPPQPAPSRPAPPAPPAEVPLLTAELPAQAGGLVVGRRLIGGKPAAIVSLDPRALSRHAVIRAGSGGGKTVLVKRLVEEAALLGIPSILIDPANDLAQLGDTWPADPLTSWLPEDAERARRYHDQTEVVIWTPGRNSGRPLQLAPLPDLAAAADDEDQLNTAVAMAASTLEEHAITGSGETAKKKEGVLAASLRYFARHDGGNLDALIGLLADLPMEAGADITGSPKLAAAMADGLRAALQTNPLLQGGENAIDPALLFGLGAARTRISVISLIGLATPAAQQSFVNQLAMALFSFIKLHPSAGLHGLTGLFVIDEAKDFLPAVTTTPSKQSLMQLAAQARKYGLGLILATQNPKDLDYKAVAQFSTQFFGKANAPQVIDFIRGLIAEKGGSGDDIGRLQKGQFYMISEGIPAPIRVAVPMCLSYHPEGKPLTEDEVLTRARNSGRSE